MKTRSDFVSNSSSCSFFVSLEMAQDIEEFKHLIGALKKQNVGMQVFWSLAEAHDRWYGTMFDGSEQMSNTLVPGCFILCDSGEDHDNCYESRYRRMEKLFTEGDYEFKLYADSEAHMTVIDDLPEVCDK